MDKFLKYIKKRFAIIFILILIFIGTILYFLILPLAKNKQDAARPVDKIIKLSEPRKDSQTSLEQALTKRRSIRKYKNEPVSLLEISQLLWAAQGITDLKNNYRTAPSAGALYPLETYVIASNVANLPAGVYKYNPQKHLIENISFGDKKTQIYESALRQSAIKEAPAIILFSAVYERTTVKYGDRGLRYVFIEAGHAAQNVYLQAVSLDLGTVVIGAFNEDEIKKIMNMPENEYPIYIMPIGKHDY